MSHFDEGSPEAEKLRRIKLKHARKREAIAKRRAKAYFLRTYYDSNKKTLWAACRAVVIGSIVIVLGLAMTVVGYFDRDFTTTFVRNATLGTTISIVDDSLRYKLKSMQYIGPIFMGIGMFLLIIACVITLESRDKHAQIIQDKSAEYRQSRRPTVQLANTNLVESKQTEKVRDWIMDTLPTEQQKYCCPDIDYDCKAKRKKFRQSRNKVTSPSPKSSEFDAIDSMYMPKRPPYYTSYQSDDSDDNESIFMDEPEKILVTAEVHSYIPEPLYDEVEEATDIITKNTRKKFHYGLKRLYSSAIELESNSTSLPTTASSTQRIPKTKSNLEHFTGLREINRPAPRGNAPIVRVESLVELSALNTPLSGISPAIQRRDNDIINSEFISFNSKTNRPFTSSNIELRTISQSISTSASV